MKAKPQIYVESRPVFNAGLLFSGLTVTNIRKVEWHHEDEPEIRGRYWTASGNDGVEWLSDGDERIACLPARMFRFFRQGVAKRRNKVTGRYLKGIVPIAERDVVVNFGANVGEVAITLAERGASVIAIEPDPNTLPALRANAGVRRIEVVPVAAWDTDGELGMYIASDSADTSAFNVSADHRVLPCRRIDTLIRERRIERVALLVGDAEGGEPEVLKGAFGILSITEYVSVCASAERCGERTLEACEAILRQANFEIICREDQGFCILIAENKEHHARRRKYSN